MSLIESIAFNSPIPKLDGFPLPQLLGGFSSLPRKNFLCETCEDTGRIGGNFINSYGEVDDDVEECPDCMLSYDEALEAAYKANYGFDEGELQ